jgi:hypothetical protein
MQGSRILEKLLRISSDFQIRVFTDRLNGHYASLFQHQFGSHVIQTLLGLSADIVERELSSLKYPNNKLIFKVEDNEGILPSMEDLVIGIGMQLSSHWKHLIIQRNASFVVRTFLNILSGSMVKQSEIRSAKSKKYNQNHNNFSTTIDKLRSVPPSFSKLLETIVEEVSEFLNPEHVRKFALNPISNPVLQILICIKNENGPLIESLVGKDSETFTGTLIRDKVGSHLLEKVIIHCDQRIFEMIFESHFKNQFVELCKHDIANFVMQVIFINY